jgi:hypothetical protein
MDETDYDYREWKDFLVQGLFGLLGFVSFLVPWCLIKGTPVIGGNEFSFIFLWAGLFFLFGAVPFYEMAKYILWRLGRYQSASRTHLAWIGFMHGLLFSPIGLSGFPVLLYPTGMGPWLLFILILIITGCISGVVSDVVVALFLRVKK